MTSITRTITVALAILALAAPAAVASPMRVGSPPITPPQSQPYQGPVSTPAHQPAVAADNGTSPLVYILPVLALIGALAATTAFVRRPARA